MGLCIRFHFEDFTIEKTFICYSTYSREIIPVAEMSHYRTQLGVSVNQLHCWYVSDCKGVYTGKYCLLIYETCKLLGYVHGLGEKKPLQDGISLNHTSLCPYHFEIRDILHDQLL